MTLLSRLGRAAGQAALPFQVMRRAKRSMPHVLAATELAYTQLSDEQARDRLRDKIQGDDEGVRDAVDRLSRSRANFVDDRAYRLLTAAATNTAVRPIDPTFADLFGQEELLGRLSLEHAFQHLAELEPRLLELRAKAQAAASGSTIEPARDSGREIDQQLRDVVGITAKNEHPLLHSDIAASIALQYLRTIARTHPGASIDMPYFAALRTGVLSGTLYGPKRPHAQN